MQQDEAALVDIVHAARLIQEFTEGIDKVTFLADLKTQSAVLHQILVLGEAVKRLSGEFRDSNVQIPWSEIARMRDRVIHHYETVDQTLVWGVVQHNIPAVIAELEPLLPPFSDSSING
jgi:uncharacterized protein with HEPN domain